MERQISQGLPSQFLNCAQRSPSIMLPASAFDGPAFTGGVLSSAPPAPFSIVTASTSSDAVPSRSSLIDFAAGSLAGSCGRFLDYPIDTIKVRMQLGGFPTYSRCIVATWHERGVRTFYTGVGSPVMAASLEKAVLFATFSNTIEWLNDVFAGKAVSSSRRPVEPDDCHLAMIGAAGAVSGFATVPILCPFELVKCHLQQRGCGTIPSTVRWLYNQGGITALFRGLKATTLRDTPWDFFYFSAFHASLRLQRGDSVLHGRKGNRTANGGSSSAPTGTQNFIAGACAGCFGNIMYPTDVIKTRMQLDPIARQNGWIATCSMLYREGGIGRFYRGAAICVPRSCVANAFVFYVYTSLSHHLHKMADGATVGEAV